MNWPEAQKNAQGEIDRVIGPDRTPAVQDIDDLPYIQALIKEVFAASYPRFVLLCMMLILYLFTQTHRWRPITPLGLPHATIQDLPYKEYIIPRGSVIYVDNCTQMLFPCFIASLHLISDV